MLSNLFHYSGYTFGSICLATTITDSLSGTTPPWWAQFGAAIMVCIMVIYLMIQYLIPKLDRINESQTASEQTLKEIRDDNKQTNIKQLDTENKLITLLSQYYKSDK